MGTAGGSFTVNAPLTATTGLIAVGPNVSGGAGGIVSLSALGRKLSGDSQIQVSSNDPAIALTPTFRRSAIRGVVGFSRGLTTGNGISLAPNAQPRPCVQSAP